MIILEIKVNKEIREYRENMFFGLTMRQFFSTLLGIAASVALYFLLRNYMSVEAVSWVCIVGAAPFIVFGFMKFNGMTADKFLVAFFRYLITPRKLAYHSINRDYEKMKPIYEKIVKEGLRENETNKEDPDADEREI